MNTGLLNSEILTHPVFPLVVEILAKSTLLLLFALLLSLLLRKRAASLRHAVWSIAFFALIALPVFAVYGPGLHVPVQMGIPAPVSEVGPEAAPPVLYAPLPERHPGPTVAGGLGPGAEGALSLPRAEVPLLDGVAAVEGEASGSGWSLPWQSAIVLAWLGGFLFVMFKAGIGFMAVRWLARRARPVEDARLLASLDRYRRALAINRPVRLVKSMYAIMPMTWGALRPVILLPADADEWTNNRLRVVLLHELAHIKRFDWLIQSVAQLATALYWFNPVVWKAESELRRERELACDEAVLDAGARASDYASHLVEIARTESTPRYAPDVALAMARRSRLEQRVRAILNPRRRCQSRVLNAAVILAGTIIAIPLLAMRPAVEDGNPEWVVPEMATPAAGPAVYSAAPLAAPVNAAAEEDTFRWQGYLAAGRTVEIKGVNGAVSARRAEGNEVVVTAAKSGRRDDPASVRIVTVEHEGGVTICALYPGEQNECLPGERGRIDASGNDVTVSFSVEVPRGVHFTGRTVNGSISASHLSSNVTAHTVNGAIHAAATGAVSAKTVNGAVKVAILNPQGRDAVHLQAVNGAIAVDVPGTADLDVAVRTLNGRIQSDFETVSVQRERYGPQRSAEGKIGRGGALLSVETVNGNVTIRRGMSSSSVPEGDRSGARGAFAPVDPVPAPPSSIETHSGTSSYTPYLAYAEALDDDLHSELLHLVSELQKIENGAAPADSCDHEDQRKCLEERRARLEAEIEERAERLAEMIEARMAELEPYIEARALKLAEKVAIPTLDRLERELPALMDRLEAEIPALLDEVLESLSRALREWEDPD